MLIKRLLHRWVLMEGEGGGDAPAGGASAAAPAAPAATPAAAAPADAVTQAPAAEPAAAALAGVDIDALKPPASMVGDAAEQPADGEQPAGEKPAETAAADQPVEYTDFTLPEGITLEDEALKSFKEAAAGAKLTQEQAQKFVDMHSEAIQRAATAPYEQWRDTQKQWQDEIKADPEFGGAKLEKETIPAIARAIKAFSPSADAEKALRQAFHFTGAGNNPEMIRFMARIGKSLSEGSHVTGKPAGNDGKSAIAKLYPTTQAGNGQS